MTFILRFSLCKSTSHVIKQLVNPFLGVRMSSHGLESPFGKLQLLSAAPRVTHTLLSFSLKFPHVS